MFVYLDTFKMWLVIYIPHLHNLQTKKKKLKELLIVAKEVSVMQKPKLSSGIITSQVSEYIWKIHNLQTIETKKTPPKIVMGWT